MTYAVKMRLDDLFPMVEDTSSNQPIIEYVMQIRAITTEQFVEIYEQLADITQQNPNSTTKAYTGSLSGIGSVTITSDPVQCLLFEV